MRAAAVILGCLVAFLALCFVGAGAFLWQRARVAQNQALYAERAQADAMAAEQARLLAALARQEAAVEMSPGLTSPGVTKSGETNPGKTTPGWIPSALKEALVAVTYGEEPEQISGLLALSQQTGSQQTGPSDAVLKALIGALKDDSTVVRSLAATLLGNMGEDAAPAAFALSENLVEPAVRDAALFALRAIGPAGDGAIAPLEAFRDSADPEVQEAARRALRAVRGRREVDVLDAQEK